jgi:hypothetical protein
VNLGVFKAALDEYAKQEGGSVGSGVTAIDILHEPDATMLEHAAASNARLRGVYPKSFALDAVHTPHITLLQCFVRTADLDRVCAAEGKVIAAAHVRAMKLEAFKYYYAPSGGTGVAGICARPTPALVKLQAGVIAAARPFMQTTGPIGAFTAPHDDPAIDAAIIQYVSTFVPNMSGAMSQPPRQHRRRPEGVSRPDAHRALHAVHLLPGGSRGVPARSIRNRGEAAEGMGLEVTPRR